MRDPRSTISLLILLTAVATSHGQVDGLSWHSVDAGGGRSADGCGNCADPDSAGSPGCSDPTCEALICAADAFCCSTSWDALCRASAAEQCDCAETWALTGTIGQPDPGVSVGGAFELTGGFWANPILFTPPCPGDTDGSGVVDIDDIVNVVLDFGCTEGPACPHGGDVDGSGTVDIDDIVVVVLNFGDCPPAP